MTVFKRFSALTLALALLLCLIASCAGQGDPVAYEDENHTHVYGYWYDSTEAGTQVRYCKICHAEETRGKE